MNFEIICYHSLPVPLRLGTLSSMVITTEQLVSCSALAQSCPSYDHDVIVVNLCHLQCPVGLQLHRYP